MNPNPTPTECLITSAENVEAFSKAVHVAVENINRAIDTLSEANMPVPEVMRVMTLIYGQVLFSGGVPRDVLVPLEQHPIGAIILRGFDFISMSGNQPAAGVH